MGYMLFGIKYDTRGVPAPFRGTYEYIFRNAVENIKG